MEAKETQMGHSGKAIETIHLTPSCHAQSNNLFPQQSYAIW